MLHTVMLYFHLYTTLSYVKKLQKISRFFFKFETKGIISTRLKRNSVFNFYLNLGISSRNASIYLCLGGTILHLSEKIGFAANIV